MKNILLMTLTTMMVSMIVYAQDESAWPHIAPPNRCPAWPASCPHHRLSTAQNLPGRRSALRMGGSSGKTPTA
ncbi:MAG: hypothetical protein IJ901_01750 [Bacteroidaceae bacterium]|nr:hypothetical protein [Bacteroidaceae bacterium]